MTGTDGFADGGNAVGEYTACLKCPKVGNGPRGSICLSLTGRHACWVNSLMEGSRTLRLEGALGAGNAMLSMGIVESGCKNHRLLFINEGCDN